MEITHNGLRIEGTVTHEAETGPSYSCGGTPASWDVEIESIEIEDLGELFGSGFMESYSEPVLAMLLALFEHTGTVPARLEAALEAALEDEIMSELCEAASCGN